MSDEARTIKIGHPGNGANCTDSPAAVSACASALQRIRTLIADRLDRIEALARAQAAINRPDSADIVAARAKLQVERDAWEETRRAQLEEFDHQRKLLADAWERLEKAQVESGRAPNLPVQEPHVRAFPSPSLVFRSADIDVMNEPIKQDILRHFHVLRRDVRRSADAEPAITSPRTKEG